MVCSLEGAVPGGAAAKASRAREEGPVGDEVIASAAVRPHSRARERKASRLSRIVDMAPHRREKNRGTRAVPEIHAMSLLAYLKGNESGNVHWSLDLQPKSRSMAPAISHVSGNQNSGPVSQGSPEPLGPVPTATRQTFRNRGRPCASCPTLQRGLPRPSEGEPSCIACTL